MGYLCERPKPRRHLSIKPDTRVARLAGVRPDSAQQPGVRAALAVPVAVAFAPDMGWGVPGHRLSMQGPVWAKLCPSRHHCPELAPTILCLTSTTVTCTCHVPAKECQVTPTVTHSCVTSSEEEPTLCKGTQEMLSSPIPAFSGSTSCQVCACHESPSRHCCHGALSS